MSYKGVFVSSTRLDLKLHREAVSSWLRKNGYFPVAMEDFGALDEEPVTACLRKVAEAELFVGVYAWRYGYIPPGAVRSITAEELAQARFLSKPRLCFLVDESYSWPAAPGVPEEGPESRELLRALKSSMGVERAVGSFTTPETLALAVVTALHDLERVQASPADPERRQQLDLADLVERFWIKGVLQEAMAESGPLLRDREERAGDVTQPWEMPVWTERGATALLPPGTPYDRFVASGRRLLILGEGGYGKTTDLLQLAARLLELARYDARQPMPVVLKLAEWGWRSRRLADWMASQLAPRHNLDAAQVRGWIDGDRLLPLLDGLDEVEPGCRGACVRAINEYLAERPAVHPDRGLAVTCRSDVVEELSERLRLRDAYALRPLSDAALDGYLAAGGPGAEPLRAALVQPGWRELAHTPLLLVMMERMLQGAGAAALGATPAASGAGLADAGGGRRRVLAAYIRAMLAKPPVRLRFTAARTRHCLAWLASEMSAHRLALYQLDDLQPSWLGGAARVWLYAIASRALSGMLLLLPMAVLPGRLGVAVLVGLAAGACAGLVDGCRLRGGQAGRPVTGAAGAAGAAPAVATGSVGAAGAAGGEAAAGEAVPLAQRPAARALMIGGAAMVCFNLVGWLWLRAAGDFEWRLDLAEGLKFGSGCGVLFGLVFGLRRGRRERGDTEIYAGLARSRWSRSKFRSGAIWPLALMGLLYLVAQLSQALGVDSPFGLGFFAVMGAVAAGIGGIAGGLLGDVQEEAEEEPAVPRRRPHPGLRRALAVTVRARWLAVAVVAALLWVLLFVLRLVPGPALGLAEWLAPAFAALGLAYWSFLVLRGFDLVQHFTLRALLWAAGRFPLRWVRFLDQAVACNLMHRVGPGYEFIHPWLLEELAAGAAAEPGAGGTAGPGESTG